MDLHSVHLEGSSIQTEKDTHSQNCDWLINANLKHESDCQDGRATKLPMFEPEW